MNEIMNHPTKSIPAFYAGQSIFLTGATGFFGKVIIEKMLRSCPDVREIFLLIRPKKKMAIDERMEKMLNLPVFDRMREEQPSNLKKLIPVAGDISIEGLGLSPADRQMLADRVTIVIHAGASVRFNDTLKYSIFVNTRSTRDICILAESMKNLVALTYISTAFSQSNKPVVEEKVYPPFTDWRKMIKIAESLDDYTLDIFTAKCLGHDAVNSYIFSKNLAEAVIQDYSSTLPCAILRPSMVMPAIYEPIPGWIDNFYGPLGLFIGGGKGVIRVAYCNKKIIADMIPVDIAIKVLIALTWKLGITTSKPDSTPLVANVTSATIRSTSVQELIQMGLKVGKNIPLENIVWTPYTIILDNSAMFYILTILLHILPAIFIDLILKLSGRKPMLVRLQRKIYISNLALAHFVVNQWVFNNTSLLNLLDLIPPDNRESFSIDIATIDVKEYFKNCTIGAKMFLLHEDINRLDKAKAHYKRVTLFVTIFKTIIVTLLLWTLYKWKGF